MTSDKLLHLFKYSAESKCLVQVSELKVDFGKGQSKFDEVVYITYDELTKTVIVMFKG